MFLPLGTWNHTHLNVFPFLLGRDYVLNRFHVNLWLAFQAETNKPKLRHQPLKPPRPLCRGHEHVHKPGDRQEGITVKRQQKKFPEERHQPRLKVSWCPVSVRSGHSCSCDPLGFQPRVPGGVNVGQPGVMGQPAAQGGAGWARTKNRLSDLWYNCNLCPACHRHLLLLLWEGLVFSHRDDNWDGQEGSTLALM